MDLDQAVDDVLIAGLSAHVKRLIDAAWAQGATTQQIKNAVGSPPGTLVYAACEAYLERLVKERG